jgi:zinc transport system ATP-binding protein
LQIDSSKKVIEIKNLSFSYDRESVLDDISLDIYERDFLVFIGPNGGGKSTLVKLILGINSLQSGQIDKLNTKIGYVPQNTNVNIDFPIKAIEVVMMGKTSIKKSIFGYSNDEISRALKFLREVGMQNFAQNRIGSLSGGERQRVMIARALYSNPKILILDEPTSSIDADGQKQIYELLKELNKNITVVVISHDISVILEYATKVAHINKKLSYHDIGSIKKEFKTDSEHICEVELIQMLGECKC